MEHELSRVNWRTELRFLSSDGTIGHYVEEKRIEVCGEMCDQRE